MDEQKQDSNKAQAPAAPAASSKSSGDMMGMLDKWFGSGSPVQLPANVKDWIAKYAWVFALIGVILRAFGLLTIFGLGLAFSGLAAATGSFSFFSAVGIGLILLTVEGVLLLVAIPGLKNQKMSGWKFAFYAEVVGVVGSLISLNIIGAVIAFIIGFYFLFQIRAHFKA